MKAKSKSETIRKLRESIEHVATTSSQNDGAVVSTGISMLDQALPHGGFRCGSIVEWMGEDSGGVNIIALVAAKSACTDRSRGRSLRRLVVVDDVGDLYPPAIAQFGYSTDSVILIHTHGNGRRMSREAVWAIEESLRCPAVGVVWTRVESLPDQTWRRLTLAAEAGGSVGMFVRPSRAIQSLAWSDVRISVEPRPLLNERFNIRKLKLSILRCRGSFPGTSFEVLFDVETHGVSVPKLADPALTPCLAQRC